MDEKPSFFSNVVEWIGVFLIAIAVFALVRTFVIAPYTVPSGSMEPTIQVGDNLFAQKITLKMGKDAQVGDIVVFKNPETSSPHDILVKRIIAHAGQTVTLEEGKVCIDGMPLDEPYAQGMSYELMQAPGVAVSYPYTVPEGCVWVMGDNRENSADSRYFGPVPTENLIGIACLRYWPLSRIGAL